MPSRSVELTGNTESVAPRPARAFTLRSGLKRWFCDSVARQGLAHTLASMAREVCGFLRDSTPSRRRQRWGDIDFDCEFRVDTTAARLGARTRFLGAIVGGAYQPSEPELFHRMLDLLPIDFREFTFIDLGSGKGRALLMASDYPFRRILGVEVLPELHRIALENIAKYQSPGQKCFSIESCCGDARDFEFPPQATVLYIFNPFPEAGLAKAIRNLGGSLARNPRPVYVVYQNPILEEVLSASPALRRVAGNIQFAIYTNS